MLRNIRLLDVVLPTLVPVIIITTTAIDVAVASPNTLRHGRRQK